MVKAVNTARMDGDYMMKGIKSMLFCFCIHSSKIRPSLGFSFFI